MAHSQALSGILVLPFDSEHWVTTAPARHAKAGAGSLHALGQAVALVATPAAIFNGRADADSKQACDVRHFEDAEGFGSAPLSNSPSAREAQLAVLQDTVLRLCQSLDDKALLSTCLTAETAFQQLGTHLEVHHRDLHTQLMYK